MQKYKYDEFHSAYRLRILLFFFFVSWETSFTSSLETKAEKKAATKIDAVQMWQFLYAKKSVVQWNACDAAVVTNKLKI